MCLTFEKKYYSNMCILGRCLSSVCVLASAYTSFCREYLPKVRYIILVDLNGDRFSGHFNNTTYVWKIPHNDELHLRLVVHIFTKLSQNLYLVNKHTSIHWHARCGTPFSFLRFFGYFHSFFTTIHVWITVSLPNFHRLCSNQYWW